MTAAPIADHRCARRVRCRFGSSRAPPDHSTGTTTTLLGWYGTGTFVSWPVAVLIRSTTLPAGPTRKRVVPSGDRAKTYGWESGGGDGSGANNVYAPVPASMV